LRRRAAPITFFTCLSRWASTYDTTTKARVHVPRSPRFSAINTSYFTLPLQLPFPFPTSKTRQSLPTFPLPPLSSYSVSTLIICLTRCPSARSLTRLRQPLPSSSPNPSRLPWILLLHLNYSSGPDLTPRDCWTSLKEPTDPKNPVPGGCLAPAHDNGTRGRQIASIRLDFDENQRHHDRYYHHYTTYLPRHTPTHQNHPTSLPPTRATDRSLRLTRRPLVCVCLAGSQILCIPPKLDFFSPILSKLFPSLTRLPIGIRVRRAPA
jgi:hypothetical protein